MDLVKAVNEMKRQERESNRAALQQQQQPQRQKSSDDESTTVAARVDSPASQPGSQQHLPPLPSPAPAAGNNMVMLSKDVWMSHQKDVQALQSEIAALRKDLSDSTKQMAKLIRFHEQHVKATECREKELCSEIDSLLLKTDGQAADKDGGSVRKDDKIVQRELKDVGCQCDAAPPLDRRDAETEAMEDPSIEGSKVDTETKVDEEEHGSTSPTVLASTLNGMDPVVVLPEQQEPSAALEQPVAAAPRSSSEPQSSGSATAPPPQVESTWNETSDPASPSASELPRHSHPGEVVQEHQAPPPSTSQIKEQIFLKPDPNTDAQGQKPSPSHQETAEASAPPPTATVVAQTTVPTSEPQPTPATEPQSTDTSPPPREQVVPQSSPAPPSVATQPETSSTPSIQAATPQPQTPRAVEVINTQTPERRRSVTDSYATPPSSSARRGSVTPTAATVQHQHTPSPSGTSTPRMNRLTMEADALLESIRKRREKAAAARNNFKDEPK